jgi:AraC-like DNA-binding protein
LAKALARAHRWQGMLEGGEYGSIEELARAEKINPSYLARVLRLTLLAPEIVECILDGRHDPERITLARLLKPFSAAWGEQLGGF